MISLAVFPRGEVMTLTLILDEHGWLILEVHSNTGKIHDRLDALVGYELLWAHSRQLQETRTVDGAGSKDDFTACLDVLALSTT